MAFLEVKNLSKRFSAPAGDVVALEDISFILERGETLAVLGASGAGKSTLLNILGGFEPPTSGHVFLEGAEIQNFKPEEWARLRRRHLGFVFQFHHLLRDFTAAENIAMPLRLDGIKESVALNRAKVLLEAVDLQDKMNRFPHELSGGEQQRVAIARALIHDPKFVLADEPTGNLDLDHGLSIFELFLNLAQQRRATVVVVTHHPDFAKKLGRSLHLNAGHSASIL